MSSDFCYIAINENYFAIIIFIFFITQACYVDHLFTLFDTM